MKPWFGFYGTPERIAHMGGVLKLIGGEPVTGRPWLEPARGLAVAVAAGLVLGVVTQVGQSLLPEGIGQLANSISPWVSVAFFVGALQSSARVAVAAGFLTLALALVGYNAMILIRYGYAGGGSGLLFWSIGSIAGGLVFGAAGRFWRSGTFRARTIAATLLGSAWVAEAGYLAIVLSTTGVAIAYALIGIAGPLVLGRTLRGRLLAWGAMLPTVALGGLGFVAFITLYDRLAGA
jgi:Family of unknown function (DUF6518)